MGKLDESFAGSGLLLRVFVAVVAVALFSGPAAGEGPKDDIGDFDRIGTNARFFDPQPRRPDIRMDAPGEDKK